jgi:predicted nucleic-acid-binding Zn-ribbon protein
MPKCPKCNFDMIRIATNAQETRYRKVWDLGLTGSGTTTTATTSGSDYKDVSATQPPELIKTKSVQLIAYECPNCKYRESYRE